VRSPKLYRRVTFTIFLHMDTSLFERQCVQVCRSMPFIRRFKHAPNIRRAKPRCIRARAFKVAGLYATRMHTWLCAHTHLLFFSFASVSFSLFVLSQPLPLPPAGHPAQRKPKSPEGEEFNSRACAASMGGSSVWGCHHPAAGRCYWSGPSSGFPRNG